MRVAVYARVSTKEQDEQTQVVAIRRFCDYHRLEIGEVFTDKTSGAKKNRPGLAALRSRVAAGEFGAVVVWKLDRVFRSLQHMLELLREFEAKGVIFYSVTENIDQSTPQGRLMTQLLAMFAQFEKDVIGERTKEYLSQAKARGIQLGRKVTRDEDVIQALRDEGLSYRKIQARTGCSMGAIVRSIAGSK